MTAGNSDFTVEYRNQCIHSIIGNILVDDKSLSIEFNFKRISYLFKFRNITSYVCLNKFTWECHKNNSLSSEEKFFSLPLSMVLT